MSDEQFLTSPFLPTRFPLFSHRLKFFEGPLKTPGPRGISRGPAVDDKLTLAHNLLFRCVKSLLLSWKPHSCF